MKSINERTDIYSAKNDFYLFSVVLNMKKCADRKSDQFLNYFYRVDYFKKNKISFLWLNKFSIYPGNKDLFMSESFQNAYWNELNRYKRWKEDFNAIIEEWKKADIEYIFIKSTGSFPHMSDNIDVLVRKKHFLKAGKILTDMGFVNLRNIQEPHKEFYRKFSGGESKIPIHLHERVCWGVPYENIDHLWANYIVSDEDVSIHYPSNDDALLINTAHCFLEDHLIKIYDLLTIKKCLEDKIDWNYVLKTAEKMYWLHAFYTGVLILNHLYMKVFMATLFPSEIIEKAELFTNEKRWIKRILKKNIFVDRPAFPFEIPHLWTRIHSSLRLINDPGFGSKIRRYKLIFKHLLDGLIHLKLRIKSHPKMFIAISGVDGSGKTAHCEALQNTFAACEIKPYYVWSRAGSLPIVSALLKVLRSFRFRKKNKGTGISFVQEYSIPKNSLLINLWRIFNVIDLILLYFIKVFIPLEIGKLVIADRYVYDSMVDLEHIGKSSNFNRIPYKILRLLTPNPDIVFFLDTCPGTIVERGSSELPGELEDKYLLYKNIHTRKSAVFIENSKNFNEESGKISKIALKEFFSKYPDKYDGYNLVSLKYK